MPQSFQPFRVMLTFDEIAGAVEIDIVARVAAGETLDVIEATQANDAIYQLGITKGEVDGMIGSEASTGCHQVRIGIVLDGERQNFLQEILVILHMAVCTFRWMLPFSIPAFSIDTVDAKQLNIALFQ